MSRGQNLLDIVMNIRANIIFHIRRIFNKDLSNILKANKRFQNIHKGKRCFILGNGPSLLKEDLSILKDEIVFTVNAITQSPIFKEVKSNYHVLADPAYFNLDRNLSEDRELLYVYDKLRLTEGITGIFIYSGYSFIKKEGYDKGIDIAYAYTGLRFTEHFRKDIDMTKNMPGAQTVVQLAIYAAIYMGIKEIYLLGCDMTGLLQNYEKRKDIFDNKDYNHAFEYSDMYKKKRKKVLKEMSNEFMLQSYANMFAIYRKLKTYCGKRGIKIINLTQGGALDVFPKEKLINIKKLNDTH